MAALPLTPAKTKNVSVSTLAGYRVRNCNNEDLGMIEEIIIDAATGQIEYVVLSLAGLFGNDRLFAVPWQLLHLNAGDRALVLHWDRAGLSGAPGFDQDDWPDFGDERWRREIDSYFACRDNGRYDQE